MHTFLLTSDAAGTYATPLRVATDGDANVAQICSGGERWVPSGSIGRIGAVLDAPTFQVVSSSFDLRDLGATCAHTTQ